MSDEQQTPKMIDEVEKAKAYRQQLGLSQVDFANRFGLPLQTYVQWERGRRQPEISAKVLLSLIVNSPDEVVRIVRRNKRREMSMEMVAYSFVEEYFDNLARKVERVVGSSWATIAALTLIVVWALSGPFLGFSELWQLAINTTTTVITFVVVFLIQATQTRDTMAIQVKLDELLRAIGEARTPIALAEDMSREELDRLRNELQDTARREQSS